MADEQHLVSDIPPVAFWEVHGENFEKLCEEAAKDAHQLMKDIEKQWGVWVHSCRPMRTYDENGKLDGAAIDGKGNVTMWEGKAEIRFVQNRAPE